MFIELLAKLRRFGFTGYFALLLFFVSLIILLNDSSRRNWRQLFAKPERRVLSVATGPVLPTGTARVVKVETPEGIQLEVYGPLSEQASVIDPLIEVLKLGPFHDSYFQFQGRATNLALKDLDGDKIYEIIAPVYSKNLSPRLFMFHYNHTLKKFEIHKE